MLLYWIWLTTRHGLGNGSVLKLLSHFATPEEIFFASKPEYLLAGMGKKEIQALEDKSLDEAQRILDECAQKNIWILTYQDAAYPNRLRNIHDAPTVLYYKGILPHVDNWPAVAVIGSRKSSPYGLICAKRLGFQIASCGGLVVSGVAAGGDAMAMLGAVSADKPVIGVLGNGVDVVYPKSSRHLYEDICRRGCLMSEYPPGTEPLARHFPARNRIISGLSLGVVVVEAPLKSGTKITAELALEQGRDLFAVPGNIGLDCCAGSNQLLKEGAILVETGWDVMQGYEALYPNRVKKANEGKDLMLAMEEMKKYQTPHEEDEEDLTEVDKKDVDNPKKVDYIDVQDILAELTEDEATLVRALEQQPMHVDELIAACSGQPARALSSLTLLEIKKYVTRLPGNRYELARKS